MKNIFTALLIVLNIIGIYLLWSTVAHASTIKHGAVVDCPVLGVFQKQFVGIIYKENDHAIIIESKDPKYGWALDKDYCKVTYRFLVEVK